MVFKAIHKATKTHVALKLLPPGLSNSSSARANFEREVEVIATLEHPNIVAVRDSGVLHGQYYFTMRFVAGCHLSKYVRSADLSLRDKMVLFHTICDAVAHAHQRGVIHRDLKPSNIIVDERGQPHVVDFGLAKPVIGSDDQADATDTLTVTGQIKGTIAYMSPEQVSGSPGRLDVRTDVYALGIILFEAVTGKFPYNVSDGPAPAFEAIRSSDPIRPRTLLKGLDSEVEAIILKAIAKDPESRYQSAAELRHDIRCWLDGLPIVAQSVSSMYLLRKILTRHRSAGIILALVFLITIGLSCLSLDLYRTARKAQLASETLAGQWNAEAANNLVFAQQVTFSLFLQTWQAGQTQRARAISGFLAEGSKERVAAAFLLKGPTADENELPSAVEGLAGQGWFEQFVLGEYYLSRGHHAEAFDAYHCGCDKLPNLTATDQERNKWLVAQMRARTLELERFSGAKTRSSGDSSGR